MRGDDELRAAHHQLVQPGDHRQLAVRRERRFRLVEHVEPVAKKAIEQQRHEGLAVRLVVEGTAAVSALQAEAVDLGGNVEETLGAKKVAVRWTPWTADEAQQARKLDLASLGLELEVLRSAFEIEARCDGDRFEQGRLSGAVLADEEG